MQRSALLSKFKAKQQKKKDGKKHLIDHDYGIDNKENVYDFQDDDFSENKKVEEEKSAADKSCDFVDFQVISQPEIIEAILRAPIQFDDDFSENKKIEQDKSDKENSCDFLENIQRENIETILSAQIEFDEPASVCSVDSGIEKDATQNIFARVSNTEVEYEIMSGFRYNSNLLFVKPEKQFYIKNTQSKIGIGYKCYVKNCFRRVYLRNEKCFIGDAALHDHGDKSEMYVNLIALNEMKTILRSVENRRNPRQVFDDVMTK